ncbi:MAG: Mrp/NBP35 family ATP-binding protein [Deltaproteobacteria bacterium]|nr:Mrp/NBP35 family ATP-binding protein [Deltaproteobacteria bacterium]
MEKTQTTCDSCSHKASCSSAGTKPCENEQERRNRQLMDRRLGSIKNKLVVMSGKGGVGKSSTAVNLALALVNEGKRVGLLDVDIHGPSIPKMLGVEDAKPRAVEEQILPVMCNELRVMSTGFLIPQEKKAIILRGPKKNLLIQQFIRDVAWGELDYLVVDCPPGTGDEPLAVLQLMGSGTMAVIVTTPQDVAVLDVKKSLTFCEELKMPVLGVIENMSGFVCPHCGEMVDIFKSGGGQVMAEEMKVPFLGRIPIDPALVKSGDDGTPYVVAYPDTETAKAICGIARNLIQKAES